MRNALWPLVGVVVLAAVFLGWRASQQVGPAPAPAVAPADTAAPAPIVMPEVASSQAPEAEALPMLAPEEAPAWADELPPEEIWHPDPGAVEALRQSRLEGDPRAPPIARPEPGREREMPTEEELADPDLYLEYEMRQQQKVYASFVEASTKKIADLKAIIERGRQEGVPPEQLAEGEEKLRRLEEMRAKLISENPDIQLPEADATEDGETDSEESP